MKLVFTNIRSIRNKSAALEHLVTAHDLDIFDITKTWLRDNDTESLLADVTPLGFNLFQTPRVGGKGGGVGFLVNKSTKTINYTTSPKSLEHLYLELTSRGVF